MDGTGSRFFDALYGDEIIVKEHDFEEGREGIKTENQFTRSRLNHPRNVVILWVVTIVLAGYSGSKWSRQREDFVGLYSPIALELERISQVFEQDIMQAPLEFQDPRTVDEAWLSLYDCKLTNLPELGLFLRLTVL
jgi:hypothetical protein